MKEIILVTIVLLISIPANIFAHPGRTDGSGGHTCRTNCSSRGLQYGEYHYHNGGASSNSSTNSSTIRKSCYESYGIRSKDNYDGTCSCISGYEFGNTILGTTQCIKTKTCTDIYGYGAEELISGKCSCKSGYIWNSLGTSCEAKTTYNSCIDTINGSYDYLSDKCFCKSGYTWGLKENKCIEKPTIEELCKSTYGINSISTLNGKCVCKTGYSFSLDGNSCVIETIYSNNTNIKPYLESKLALLVEKVFKESIYSKISSKTINEQITILKGFSDFSKSKISSLTNNNQINLYKYLLYLIEEKITELNSLKKN